MSLRHVIQTAVSESMGLKTEHMNIDQKIVVKHIGDIVMKEWSNEFAKTQNTHVWHSRAIKKENLKLRKE